MNEIELFAAAESFLRMFLILSIQISCQIVYKLTVKFCGVALDYQVRFSVS